MKENLFAFINSARVKDAVRYFMEEAYFDKEASRIVATDGKRLHYADLDAASIKAFGFDLAGYYALDEKRNTAQYLEKLSNEAQFPNYKKVIPSYSPSGKATLLDLSNAIENIPVFYAREGIATNYNWLKDLAKGSSLWRFALDPIDPKRRAIHFIADGNKALHAVIMPIRIEQ